MASEIYTRAHVCLVALLFTLSLLWAGALRAQEAARLPDYVIKEFGKPPAVPKGPLSKAFITSPAATDLQHYWHWKPTGRSSGALANSAGSRAIGFSHKIRRRPRRLEVCGL
jgi:hypothetical protein